MQLAPQLITDVGQVADGGCAVAGLRRADGCRPSDDAVKPITNVVVG